MIHSPQKICCVAGTSGGHIIPCLQFAYTHYKISKPTISFISTSGKLDEKIIQQFPEIYDHLALSLPAVPYKKWWKLPFFFASFLKAIYTSFFYLKKNKPDRIVSTGGIIAVPVICAARLLHIPVDLFELNVIPGKATSFSSNLTTNVFVCFEKTKHYFKKPCTYVSYPIRFTQKDLIFNKNDIFSELTFDPAKKTLLILGGSQGSEFLNVFLQTIPLSLLKTFNIIHQTGNSYLDVCTHFYTQNGISHSVFDYKNNLAPFYHSADLVICRAGAGTLFETLFFKKQCLVIPLETTITDHQLDNAQDFAQRYPEFFTVFRQKDLITNPDLFITALQK